MATNYSDREVPIPQVSEFADADGVYWTVREVDGRTVPGARGPKCLVFDCQTVVRRVWNFPSNWRELPPEQLIALSWRP